MTARHVEDGHRRRLLVRRHLLTVEQRSNRSIEEVVGALALVHSTDPSTPHLSIAARSDVSAAEIDAWCYKDRSMLRHTTVRRTEGRIARGRPTGSDYTSGAWTWEAVETRLPGGIEFVKPDEALRGLLARHLATFAPATVTDLAWWAGVPKGRVKAALAEIGGVEVRLDGIGEAGFVLPGDELDVDVTEGTVALLPGLDSTTMGWKQRAWYVDDRPETGLFDRNGNAGPTIWLDGRVVGAWTQRANGEITTELIEDVGSAAEAAIDAEVDRLMGWIGDVRIKWRYPTPITKQLTIV